MQKDLKSILVIPLYLIGFIVIGLVFGYFTFKVMSYSKTVEVPDLKGKTVIEANNMLSKNRLNMKVEGEDHDPLISAGRIIRQDIPPGNKVKEQRGIKVVISKGPKVWSMPQVTGITLNEAESVLSKSGIRINRIIRVHSSDVESNIVIAQRPEPDEQIQESMSLVVNAGPYGIIYYLPDFSGRHKEEAAVIAEKMGLKAEFSGSGTTVKSQRPKPNTAVRSGETIYLQMEGETRPNG